MFSTINRPRVTSFTVIPFCQNIWEVLLQLQWQIKSYLTYHAAYAGPGTDFKDWKYRNGRLSTASKVLASVRTFRWKCVSAKPRKQNDLPTESTHGKQICSVLHPKGLQVEGIQYCNELQLFSCQGFKSTKPRHFICR